MSNMRKSIILGLSAVTIACSSPASAQFGGFGGMGMMGMGGFPGMGMGGFGGMGGMGMGGMGMGGMGMAGMAISALAAVAQQNQYGGYGYRRARYRAYGAQPYAYPQNQNSGEYYGYPQGQYNQDYAAPQTPYSGRTRKTARAGKGRRCYQQQWDAAEGYVNVAAPCH